MNILFVHYGTFSSNSMNHIGPFAAELKKQGHNVAITLPAIDPTFGYFPYPEIPVFTFEDFLGNPHRFEGRGPNIIHAWTPREIVRQFVESLQQIVHARCIIHLEDDEDSIRPQEPLSGDGALHRTDPNHGSWFMESADGFTTIIDSLIEDIPRGIPYHVLSPGFDQIAAQINPEPAFSKAIFGIPEHYKVITYPGGASGPNGEDLIDLFEAVNLLNEHGTPTILLKTGFPDLTLRSQLPANAKNWIRDVGFLKRNQVWCLIELADIVVQPGRINAYNEKRLPSKLPDFFCLGKPVITTRANIGKSLINEEQALILHDSRPEEIAAKCQRLLSDDNLRTKIANEGKKLGNNRFNLTKNTQKLSDFYAAMNDSSKASNAAKAGDHVAQAIEKLSERLRPIKKPDEEIIRISDYLRTVTYKESQTKRVPQKKPPIQVEMQLYFPQSPAQLELGSLRLWHLPRKHQQFKVPFSPPEPLEWLRIDPGQFPGSYIIKSWALLDKDEEVLYQWTPEDKTPLCCQPNGITIGPATIDGQEYWALTHDPQLLFAPLPELPPARIQWLTIEFITMEAESPLQNRLSLRRRLTSKESTVLTERNQTITQLLETVERRKSFYLRLVDRIRKR